jgi:serine/threonine protein kinase/WD40 repeat protein
MSEETIFAAAREKTDPTERAAYLDEACAGDPALRARVEALLRSHEEGGEFLNQPAVARPTDPEQPVAPADAGRASDGDASPDSRIGPYKLLQQIGEGGMGVVWMAEQTAPVRRRVAVKVIKPGMDSAQVLARFEAERQALALMDHPNIARVLDAGTVGPVCRTGPDAGSAGQTGPGSEGPARQAGPTGRPYFVMELVKGVPIGLYCDEHRLTPAERLALFVPVCQAVQHAHQKGIIHRDLKPTNILVASYDGRPVPKVIDFGVAKALGRQLTERTLFTGFGSIIGTLEYMSPEQAEFNSLDIDTRSDIYSLGVLLYELLTGSTPLDRKRLSQAAIMEALRVIREEEPPRPSTRLSESKESLASISAQRHTEPTQLARLLRGELDWIVMKALDKDRGRRYETANGLARDLERYLADEPVEACPPTAGYRLRKFARKHRAVLSTVTAFVALLLLAAGVSTWLAVQAKRAEASADEQRSAAETAEAQTATERDHAQREWQRAEDAAGRANASAAETARALDRLTLARGIQLADEGDLFTGLLWLARPLERGGLTPEEDRTLRTRFACYLRHTPGRPVLRHLFFHEEEICEVRFSADARRLLTASGDTLRVWDLHSGDCLGKLSIHSPWGKAQLNSDGTRVLVVDGRGLWTWDVGTSRLASFSLLNPAALTEVIPGCIPVSPWQALALLAAREWHNHEVDSAPATLSPDGRQALVALGPRIQLFDLETRRSLQSWPKPSGYREGVFSRDGSRILANADSPRTYNAHPEPGAKTAVELSGAGYPLGVSDDGRRVVTITTSLGNKEELMTVREASSGKVLCPISVSWDQTGASYQGLADLSPDGHLLAFRLGRSFQSGRLQLWDVDRSCILAERPVRQHSLRGVYFRPDGRQVATTDVRTVRLWDVPSLDPSGPGLPCDGPFGLNCDGVFRFSPDGSMCATAAEDGTVQVWSLAGRRPLRAKAQLRPTDVTRTIDFWMFVQTVQNQQIMIYETGTGRNLAAPGLEKIPHEVRTKKLSAAISPDKTRLLTIVMPKSGTIELDDPRTAQLWDAATGAAVGRPLEHTGTILHAEFSLDSRLVVTTSRDGTARLWNAQSGLPQGEPLRHLQAGGGVGGVLHATFSRDSSLLVTSGGSWAQVWRIDSHKPQGKPLMHGSYVNRAVFSPDGKSVATASSDFTARLWNSLTGEPAGPALGHRGPVFHVAFSPDSRIMITENFTWNGYDSAQLRLWEMRTQQELSPTILWTENFTDAPLFTEDGRSLIGRDSGMQIDVAPMEWPVADLIKLAQLHAGQRLDAGGGLVTLSKEDYRALWKELRARYPSEFAVSDESVLEWRGQQLKALTTGKDRTGVPFHRRWFARELTAAGWHPGPVSDLRNRIVPDRRTQFRHWLQRLMALALFGRHAEATTAAAAVAAQWPADLDALCGCARVYALAAGAVEGDRQLADSYAASAVGHLGKAVKAGFKDGSLLRNDPDLDALRGRKDFIDLLADLAKKP